MNNESPANRIELTRSEVEALLPARALGVLEPGEALAVERYLRDHETLMVRSASLEQITAHLGYAAVPVAPSAALRQQILASAAATLSPQQASARTPATQPVQPRPAPLPAPASAPRRAIQPRPAPRQGFDFFQRLYVWRTAAVVATAVLLIIAVGALRLLDTTLTQAQRLREGTPALAALKAENDALMQSKRQLEQSNSDLTSEIDTLQQAVRQILDQLQTRQGQLASLQDVQRAVTLIGTPNNEAVDGTLFVRNNNRATVVLNGLQALPDSQTYQLWALPGNDAAPVPVDIFAADSNVAETTAQSKTFTVVDVDLPTTSTDSSNFAVSIEPAGGSETPSDVILMGA